MIFIMPLISKTFDEEVKFGNYIQEYDLSIKTVFTTIHCLYFHVYFISIFLYIRLRGRTIMSEIY